MNPDLSTISNLIVELLSEKSPEYGARLKQRLNAVLLKQGYKRFNEKNYSAYRFKDFLQRNLSSSVTIVPPTSTGDILIHLKSRIGAEGGAGILNSKTEEDKSNTPVIRSDIWQAFLHSDRSRKRFYDREDNNVLSIRVDPSNIQLISDKQSTDRLIEITPLNSKVQMEWMRSFLQSSLLSTNEKHAIESLFSGEYSSALNATFTRALGEYSRAWRSYRTNLIYGIIADWCNINNIKIENLYAKKTTTLTSQASSSRNSAKLQVIQLLETMNEEDVLRIVMPILEAIMYIKARA